jgi:hypothetical protein
MSNLREKLSKFESQLQDLIEIGSTRIIPGGRQQVHISSKLVEAMRSSVKLDHTGKSIAADIYILRVGNEAAQILAEDPEINEALLQILAESGDHLGLIFQTPPRIKISVDDSIGSKGFEILAGFGLQDGVETSTLAIEPADGTAIPKDAFLIINGQQVVALTEQVVNLGRRPDNQIVVDDPQVSRNHAQLRVIKNRYVIFDLASTGGTFVNKIRVEQANLFPGDVISLAGVDLVYGQDARFFSGDSGSSTQPLIPFPDAENY